MTVLSNDASLESDRLCDLERELADHKREAYMLTGQVLTLEQDADRYVDLVPSLADKAKAIEERIAAIHEAQAPPRAVPLELVARVTAAEKCSSWPWLLSRK